MQYWGQGSVSNFARHVKCMLKPVEMRLLREAPCRFRSFLSTMAYGRKKKEISRKTENFLSVFYQENTTTSKYEMCHFSTVSRVPQRADIHASTLTNIPKIRVTVYTCSVQRQEHLKNLRCWCFRCARARLSEKTLRMRSLSALTALSSLIHQMRTCEFLLKIAESIFIRPTYT